eukprot:s3739_g5.t1
MLVFSTWPDVQVGHTLTQSSHTRSDDDVHQQLIELSVGATVVLQAVAPSDWERITGFVQHFMPSFSFSLPDISPDQWMRSVRRFKPKAARGADGYAKQDLLHMSPVHITWLLQLLNGIEIGSYEWPRQLQEGLVLALAKCPDAHAAGSYRPIVLLSIIYRCWSSLRSRQLLRMLEPYIHGDALGFLPGREAAQSWLQVQSCVELAVQSGQTLSGLAVDLIKAFNNIHRPQWFMLARHVGLPMRILAPWEQFLSSFTRRFQVNNHLSATLTSDVGFAEGDPLSVLAMAVLDWALHVYQQNFAPIARTLSFVDNLSIISKITNNLVWAYFTLRAFLELWGLEIDSDKSYVWSTTSASRAFLKPLGLTMVGDVSELGGSLTFGSAARVRIFLARGARLERRWSRLRQSRAPLSQKLASLPMVFWPAALHGALGCVFAESHLHQLRKKAVSVTGLRCGGSNPLLRLSLAEPMTADPGFFHLRTCVMDFRRLCSKSPDLLVLWRSYMLRFDGRKLPGPFFKLVDLFSTIGWCILEPPCFLDHDGLEHDLMRLPNKAIDLLLRDAWLQHVAQQVQHRGTMTDLQGLDYGLTMLDRKTMTPQDLGKTMALQSGSFISDWVHSKFDKTKEPLCPVCNVPNTLRHWTHCPMFAGLHEVHLGDRAWIANAPDCTVHHLLVPRSPFALELKHYFMGIEDTTRLQSLLDGSWHFIGPDIENHDLWQQAAELIDCLPPDCFFVHWIPSHLDTSLCETTWEEWAAEWNDVADRIAVQVNQQRDARYQRLKHDALVRHELWTQRLRTLRHFFFAVSEKKRESADVLDLTVSDIYDWTSMGLTDAFSDEVPISWRVQLSSELTQLKYPSAFVFQLFELAFSLEVESDAFAAVTFLEFTIWCIIEQETPFPFWNPDTSNWELRFLIRGIQKPEIGIHLPCDGLAFCTSSAVKERLAVFCVQIAGQSGFRKTADLAKPFG